MGSQLDHGFATHERRCRMARIDFRGKTYRSEFEMPPDVLKAYRREKERRAGQNTTISRPLTDIVDMSPEVKRIYERALGDVEDKPGDSRNSRELPGTEDLYRQSAPEELKHLPSDESIYRPSEPLIDPAKSAIEPESVFTSNRLVTSVLWALILGAIAFFVMQFFF
jgi:hypothetical protein